MSASAENTKMYLKYLVSIIDVYVYIDVFTVQVTYANMSNTCQS